MSRKGKAKQKKSVGNSLNNSKVDESRESSDDTPNGTESSDKGSYEVEAIVGDRVSAGKTQYRIRWKGYTQEDDTWENESQLECEDLIIAYLEKKDAAAAGSTDEDSADETSPKKRKGSKKKLTPAKKSRVGPPQPDEDGEFEVENIKDVHLLKNGSRLFLVKWRGYTSKDDTWEPEDHLKGTKVLDKYLKKMEEAKKLSPKQLRMVRKHTEHYTLATNDSGRRLSRRHAGKQRVTYHDAE